MKTTAQLAKCLANVDFTDLSSDQVREKMATVICNLDLDLDDAKALINLAVVTGYLDSIDARPTYRLVLGRVMRSLERKGQVVSRLNPDGRIQWHITKNAPRLH